MHVFQLYLIYYATFLRQSPVKFQIKSHFLYYSSIFCASPLIVFLNDRHRAQKIASTAMRCLVCWLPSCRCSKRRLDQRCVFICFVCPSRHHDRSISKCTKPHFHIHTCKYSLRTWSFSHQLSISLVCTLKCSSSLTLSLLSLSHAHSILNLLYTEHSSSIISKFWVYHYLIPSCEVFLECDFRFAQIDFHWRAGRRSCGRIYISLIFCL